MVDEQGATTRGMLTALIEAQQEQMAVQTNMYAQEAERNRQMMVAQMRAFQTSTERNTTTLAQQLQNITVSNSSTHTSTSTNSKTLVNVKKYPPPVCPKKANIIVFLRTQVEDHICNNFTTRAEMVFAIAMVFSLDSSWRREAKELAETHLPQNPKTEKDRLTCYRAIAASINDTRSPNLSKSMVIAPLLKMESINTAWRRARIIVEEEYHTMGVSSSVINSKTLEHFLNSNKNVVSKVLCAKFYGILLQKKNVRMVFFFKGIFLHLIF